MRLIDAEKLRAEYLGMPNCYNGFSDTYDKAMIVDMVDEQPTIDAVPVVRCEDCIHWGIHKWLNIPWCREMHIDRGAEDFCSMAERKTDA